MQSNNIKKISMKTVKEVMTEQKQLYAIVEDAKGLNKKEKVFNSHLTSSTYFYVNGNRVSVSNPHFKLTESMQMELLDWFLNDREFKIKY